MDLSKLASSAQRETVDLVERRVSDASICDLRLRRGSIKAPSAALPREPVSSAHDVSLTDHRNESMPMSASGDWPVSGRSDSNPCKISMAAA